MIRKWILSVISKCCRKRRASKKPIQDEGISTKNKSELYDLTVSVCKHLNTQKERLSESVQNIGYITQGIEAQLPLYKYLDEHYNEYQDIVDSDVSLFFEFEKALMTSEEQSEVLFAQMDDIVSQGDSIAASGTFAASAFSLSSTWIIENVNDFNYMPLERKRNYEERYMRFDKRLGESYKEIDEILHSTISDPERGASFIIRQTVDHLMDLLAPDAEVRNSPYFELKKDYKDPNAVFRPEKYVYAASKHIKIQQKKAFIIERTKHFNAVYRRLNAAHARGEFDVDKQMKAIQEMKIILQDWADAIGI